MTKKFLLGRDRGGNLAYSLEFADATTSAKTTLAAGIAQSITIPSTYEKWQIICTYSEGSSVWVANNETPTVPTSSFVWSAGERKPIIRMVNAGDVISFVTSDASAEVGVVLYAV